MIGQAVKPLTGVFAVIFGTSVAHAAVVDQYVSSGQYGSASANNGGAVGWANATISTDGSGVNQTAHLFHVSYSPNTGYNYWSGDIPVEYVTVTGVASISVSVDTCTVNNVSGCGQVDLTVTTDEPATGWIDNGVREYDWNGVIYREVGARQVRFSSATGSVHGIPLNTSRAFMGKFNEVTITVTTGN
jgi:hypothetical protein